MNRFFLNALLSCAALSFPALPAAGASTARVVQITGPVLSVPQAILAQSDAAVAVPVSFAANGYAISSVAFSIDFDQTWLAFDPTDSDGDGVPDAVAFNLPAAFGGSVSFDAADTDGELDFLIADVFPPLVSLPDSVLVSITFATAPTAVLTTAQITFSTSPPASFGNTAGQSVPGATIGGSVHIQGLYDLNDDGQVDVLDIQVVASCWQTVIGGSCPLRYDVDRDSDIDIVDAQRVAGAWQS